MVYKQIVTIAVVFLSVHFVHSQSKLGLNYPMGMPQHGGTGSVLALAGTGVAIGNDFFGLSANPANLSVSQRATFSSSISGDIISLRDTVSDQHYTISLRTLTLSIPVGRVGTFGVTVEPYSSAAVRHRLNEKLNIDGIFDDSKELAVLSEGGAINWQVGWGYNIKKVLRVGIAYKRFSFNQTIAAITQMSLTTQSGGKYEKHLLDSTRTKFATNGIRGGFQLPIKSLTIGLSGEYYFIDKAKGYHFVYGTRDRDTIENSSRYYYFKPPPSGAVGLSYQFNPQWLVAVDVGMTLWERYYSETAPVEELRNAWNVSGGIRFIPAPNLLTPKLYEIMQYRAGVRYTQLPGVNGTEIAAVIGTGLPMLSNGGMFDIIFEYCRRWDKRYIDYSENIFSLKLGINGGRKWYQSSDENY